MGRHGRNGADRRPAIIRMRVSEGARDPPVDPRRLSGTPQRSRKPLPRLGMGRRGGAGFRPRRPLRSASPERGRSTGALPRRPLIGITGGAEEEAARQPQHLGRSTATFRRPGVSGFSEVEVVRISPNGSRCHRGARPAWGTRGPSRSNLCVAVEPLQVIQQLGPRARGPSGRRPMAPTAGRSSPWTAPPPRR